MTREDFSEHPDVVKYATQIITSHYSDLPKYVNKKKFIEYYIEDIIKELCNAIENGEKKFQTKFILAYALVSDDIDPWCSDGHELASDIGKEVIPDSIFQIYKQDLKNLL